MMTTDMDLRTAPPRRSAGPTVAPSHHDGPARGPRPRQNAHSPAPRRLAAGVLVGALTMFVVALLDTVTGAQVPVLGSFASLPAPVGQEGVVEIVPPPDSTIAVNRLARSAGKSWAQR